MTIGNCLLCGRQHELADSHVWPAFGYKRFVSDQKAGGKFVDLSQGREHNRQYTKRWLCQGTGGCEQKLGVTESHADEFCRLVEQSPESPQSYDHRLHRFAVSVSWRTLRFHAEKQGLIPDRAGEACRCWGDYLREKRNDVSRFTQHLFVVTDPLTGLHRGLGGEVFLDQGAVLTQVGPLFVVGLLGRRQLSLSEIGVWERCRISLDGGMADPVAAWRVGENVTRDFTRLLAGHERLTRRKVAEWARRKSERRRR